MIDTSYNPRTPHQGGHGTGTRLSVGFITLATRRKRSHLWAASQREEGGAAPADIHTSQCYSGPTADMAVSSSLSTSNGSSSALRFANVRPLLLCMREEGHCRWGAVVKSSCQLRRRHTAHGHTATRVAKSHPLYTTTSHVG